MNEYQIENTRRSWHSTVASKFADDLAIHPSQKTDRYLQYADDDLKAVILAEQSRRHILVQDRYTSTIVSVPGKMSSDFDDVYGNDVFNVSLHSSPAILAESYIGDQGRETIQTDVRLYLSVVDLEETDTARFQVLQKDHGCPNCGAINKLEKLVSQGCPYCGSRFTISDLYPRIFGYYMTNPPVSKAGENILKIIALLVSFAIPLAAAFAIFGFFKGDSEISQFLFQSQMVLAAVFMGLVLSLFIGGAIFNCVDKMAFGKQQKSDARRKLTQDMEEFCPDFSYDYFEGDISSSVKKVVFSDDLANCPVYAGKPHDLGFADVVGCYYLGGLEYERLFVKDDAMVFVDLTIPLRIARSSSDRILLDVEKYELRVARRIENMYDPTFSFSVVTCKYCGGSFNAFSKKRCPYCGKTYDASYNAWVVVGMKRKEEDFYE